MQSDGGLTPMNKWARILLYNNKFMESNFCTHDMYVCRFIGSRAILSGPAGGVVSDAL